jgi:hypothetical protein
MARSRPLPVEHWVYRASEAVKESGQDEQQLRGGRRRETERKVERSVTRGRSRTKKSRSRVQQVVSGSLWSG